MVIPFYELVDSFNILNVSNKNKEWKKLYKT